MVLANPNEYNETNQKQNYIKVDKNSHKLQADLFMPVNRQVFNQSEHWLPQSNGKHLKPCLVEGGGGEIKNTDNERASGGKSTNSEKQKLTSPQ